MTEMRTKTWLRVGAVVALATLAACGGGDAAAGTAKTMGAAGSDAARAAEQAGDEQYARASAGISADELRAFELTREGLAAWHRVQMAVMRAHVADPSLQDKLKADDGESILDLLQGQPVVRRAVDEAGLTPREAALLTLAVANGSLGMALEAQGEPLTGDIAPGHVAFVKAHRAELERMTAEMAALEEQIAEPAEEEQADEEPAAE